MKSLAALILCATASFAAEPPALLEGKTISQWSDQLSANEFRQQWFAAYVLGSLGPRASAAIPALHATVDVRSGRNEYARSMAAWALGRIGPAATGDVPFLAETMKTTKLLAVRRSAAEALGRLGPAAKSAESALLGMLDDADEITRVHAATALWNIGRHPKAIPAIVDMLHRGSGPQAYAAAVALGQIGQAADTIAPMLIDALENPSADVRRAAARSLGQLGKAAFPAIKKAKALESPNSETRRLLVEALRWMGSDAEPALIAAMKDSQPAIRRAAARALGELASGTETGRPALENAVNDPDEDVRAAAAKALKQIRAE